MTGKPAWRVLPAALLLVGALGVASSFAQGALSPATSIDELRRHAEAGEVAAMEELGRRLMSGAGTARDAPAGAQWYRRAAEAGSPTASFTLGVLYERGVAVERDARMAVEWYRKAAAGVPAAKHNLALLLRDGRGVAQDLPKAVELLRAAAYDGLAASMFMLGDMYERGSALPKDVAAALAWFILADRFERQANDSTETPLARNAQARAAALQRALGDADRERAGKIGHEEFQRIAAALSPKPAPSPEPVPPVAATQPVPAAPSAAEAIAWPSSPVDQVKAIQQALIELQHLRGKADGAAGPATRAAIRAFEKSAGLAQTGEPTRELHAALSAALAQRAQPAPSEPWPANAADQIRAIQRLLAELKLLNAEPTGTVGPLTRRGIRDFQRKAGLPETGEPSQALFEALKAARSSSAPSR
jgi:peptidoglycan hydrolase-like protein with peptidoglycan-binding domain